MEAIFRWSASHPVAALAAALLPCLALSTGLAFLRIDGSLGGIFSEEDPRYAELLDVGENFGSRSNSRASLLVLAESPSLFERETLVALRDLSRNLAGIPGIDESVNLFETVLPTSGEGFSTSPPLAEIPESPADLLAKRGKLLSSGFVRDRLLNRDGDAMLLVFFLDPDEPQDRVLERFLQSVHASPAAAVPRLTLTPVGVPIVEKVLGEYLLRDLVLLGPVALLIVCATIFAFYRSLSALFLPVLTGIPSVLATLGFMGWAGFEVNFLLSAVPVVLLVLGSTEDLHIVSDYLDNSALGLDGPETAGRTGAALGKALILTSSTTIVSFLFVATGGFSALQEFAICCAFGLAANYWVTVFAAPAFLASRRPRRGAGSGQPAFLLGFGRSLETALRKRPAPMVIASLAFLAASLVGLPRLKSDADELRVFRPDSEITLAYERVVRSFGVGSLTVTVETGRHNGFADPERYGDLVELHEFLVREDCAPLDLTVLHDDLLPVEAGSPGGKRPAPTTESLNRFLSGLPSAAKKPFLDYDGSRAAIRFLVRGDAAETWDPLEMERRILEFAAAELDPSVTVRVVGEALVFAHLCDLLVGHLLQNLLVFAAGTAVLIALVTRSARQGVLFLIPNVFPVATTFGIMGWLDIPVNLATFPVTLIAFGIAVDDTIHLFARFNLARRLGLPPEDAAATAMRKELRPLLAASAAVALGYCALFLSPLRTHAEVGLLFALTTFSACVAELILTPILLRHFGGTPTKRS